MKKPFSSSPFASLLSLGRARSARAEQDDDKDDKDKSDDERKQREGESDDDYAKRMEELDREDDERDDVLENGEDPDAESEDDGDDKEKDQSKKAARAAERVRCARIVAHGLRLGVARQACVFAFDTGMSSKAAIAALDAGRADQAPPARRTLSERMQGTTIPNPGSGGGDSQMTLAQKIVAAGKKRRGEA
ncbi:MULTISPECIES: hypothetical protein [Achromobacter]|uniref:hypothetical protein n=1 Tax=Achromobacter TaxID=222 RepID=UPI000A7CCB21|nr:MULTISPECIES: hypothetical protein [Achromobacter]MCM2569712.1 hypothetical protein [Achromobacter xylosoxidans]